MRLLQMLLFGILFFPLVGPCWLLGWVGHFCFISVWKGWDMFEEFTGIVQEELHSRSAETPVQRETNKA